MTGFRSNDKNGFLLPPKKELPDETRAKIKKRRRKKSLKGASKVIYPLKILGFTLIIISLCYLSIVQLKHLFFGTSYFEIKKIKVINNKRLTTTQILKLANIAPGLNIFKINRDQILSSITSDPNIKDAKITFEGMYNIKITVQERTPLFYAKQGSHFLEISDDGMVIGSKPICKSSLPIITGLKLENFKLGDNINNLDSFFVARKWVRNLKNNFLENISEINFSSSQNPYVYLTSGEKIYPSSLEKFKKQKSFLRALLDNLKKNNVEPIYLDLRAPGEIVIKPKKNI